MVASLPGLSAACSAGQKLRMTKLSQDQHSATNTHLGAGDLKAAPSAAPGDGPCPSPKSKPDRIGSGLLGRKTKLGGSAILAASAGDKPPY
jgi:hypothetical protein